MFVRRLPQLVGSDEQLAIKILKPDLLLTRPAISLKLLLHSGVLAHKVILSCQKIAQLF
jgi:hypothetical protein